MIVKIIHTAKGTADKNGATSRVYEAGEEINAKEPWQVNLMQTFINEGWAEEIKVINVTEQKVMSIADDPEVEQLDIEPAPKKRGRPRKGD